MLAALVGGGGLVARNRGKKEAAPAAVTPGGADLASPAGAVSAQSPPTPTTPTPTPRQQPEDEILWEDLGERDRAKFEQAIRDFGIES